jgi:hypothetical protein
MDPLGEIVAASSGGNELNLYGIDSTQKMNLMQSVRMGNAIVSLEFLFSQRRLLIVVSGTSPCRLSLFHLGEFTSKEVASLTLDSHPSHLIPLRSNPDSFVCITQSKAYLIDASSVSLTGTFPEALQPLRECAVECSDMDMTTKIVDFTNSVVHNSFESFYLATSDGQIIHCSVLREDPWLVFKSACRASCTVHRMTMLENDNSWYCIALFGGTSDGEIIRLRSYISIVRPRRLIPNVRPVSDICIGLTKPEAMEDTIYVACGDKANGVVKEVHGALNTSMVFRAHEFDYYNCIWCFKLWEMKSVVFLSSPFGSRMLVVKDQELCDITRQSGIQEEERTIFFSPLPDFAMLQVLSNRVTVQLLNPHLLQAKVVKSCSVPGTVNFAGLCSDFVILITSNPNSIILLKILSDLECGVIQIDIITKLDIPFEVSSLACPHIPNLPPLCILGVYDCAVTIVTLDSLLTGYFSGHIQHFPSTINYIELLDIDQDSPTLIFGTRGGELYVVRLEQNYSVNVLSMTEIGTFLYGLKICGPAALLAISLPQVIHLELEGSHIRTTPLRCETFIDAAPFHPIPGSWIFLSGKELTCYDICAERQWLDNSKVVGTVSLRLLETCQSDFRHSNKHYCGRSSISPCNGCRVPSFGP